MDLSHPVQWRPQRPSRERLPQLVNHKVHRVQDQHKEVITTAVTNTPNEDQRNHNYYGKNTQNTLTTRPWEKQLHSPHMQQLWREGSHAKGTVPRADLCTATFCHTKTHDTVACKSKPKTSTPLESPSAGNYHPAPSPMSHSTSIPPEDPNKSVIPNHVTQPSPVTSSYSEDIMKAWITRLDQNQAETREKQDQKRLLENIEVYDGNDKTQCLPWVNRVHQATSGSSMEFRKALLYKAGPTVFGIIASTPKDISDLELKQIIL